MNGSLRKPLQSLASESLGDRLKHLVGNSIHSDFTFIIVEDNVEIPAHKLIIASASPVLDRIVYGTDKFSSANSTVVDGTSKESFMEILRYIYTDNININDDNVFDILNKANYYGLSYIEMKCFDYLQKHLNPSNVTWIFHQLFYSYSSSELLQYCLRTIQLHPIACFNAEEFPSLSIDEIKLILGLDPINCSEIDLFEAILKLAKFHCIVDGLEPTGANQRKVLNSAEKLLRLETLTKCEFDSCLQKQSDFFSTKEVEEFYAAINNEIPTLAVKRKVYTYDDAVWLEIDNPNDLPPSCFYTGSSLFICRIIDIENEESDKNEVLPYGFNQSSIVSFYRGPELKIEVLCGSGYEWRKVNGEIPQAAVSISQKNGEKVFIGRGMLLNSLTIGPVYSDGRMYAYIDEMLHDVDEETDETNETHESEKREITEFEVLVACNVKHPYVGNESPHDAVFIGYNENNFKTYLGRAWFNDDLLPAKVILGNGTTVPYGSTENTVSEFDFVRMDPGTYAWEKATDGNVPQDAIAGGCTESGETLYFGRILHEGIHIPGKVHPSHRVLYVPYREHEINFISYEVLVKVANVVKVENC